MKYRVNIWTGMLGILLAAGAVAAAEPQNTNSCENLIGKGLPEFDLEGPDAGKRYRSSDYGGKVVLLDFWSVDCKPCRAEMPYLQKLYEKFKNNGEFFFLAVNTDGDMVKNEEITGLIGREKYTFPVGLDKGYRLCQKYGVSSFPALILADKSGKVQKVEVGFGEGNDFMAEWEKAITDLLQKKTNATPEAAAENAGSQPEGIKVVALAPAGSMNNSEITLAEKDFIKIETNEFAVYYPSNLPSARGRAQNTLEIIQRAWVMEDKILGIKVRRDGIILHQEENHPQAQTIRGFKANCWLMSLSQDDNFAYWGYAHEVTETCIPLPVPRWCGDGIAEYVAYRACKELSPETCRNNLLERTANPSDLAGVLRKSLQKGVKYYNLPAQFTSKYYESEEAMKQAEARETADEAITQAGYAVSFWFWKKLADKHGEKIISEFLRQGNDLTGLDNEMGEKNSDRFVKLLEKITGEKDLAGEITRIDMATVISDLKAEGAKPDGGIEVRKK